MINVSDFNRTKRLQILYISIRFPSPDASTRLVPISCHVLY